ncbi:LysR family transcriptional regulator, regulator for metE and metH [Myxococcus fulvus]|uniref:LysR family transcriptional regulator, regulator for metE and metH n=1 Tax=Myxococcus fulvus TaxID=33 RepID=A0A511T239_MYXFU|nr:LysR substrate-binding domain-containing protein [Myxococcus fulvus]GEN08215.1 XRE family transcriptional regulator [Myxococcus fulvus]SEU22065.1 LysR family transcriptional regulator, regulator for metE and metH [Myxococcus fulvus]
MLELRHFKLVAAVADTGSLAAASRQLHLTSSALSHQLRDAEERLGVQLFQRRQRRLLLTGAGEKLLLSARRVLSEVAQAEAVCRAHPQDDLLRLSTGCYTVYGWLPPILGQWQAEHPRVELRIVLEATRQPLGALMDGQLDLALTPDVPKQARLARTPLFEDELMLVVPETHAFARRGHVTAQDLVREHLLTYAAPREQLDVFTRVLWPAGLEPQRVSPVPLTEALIELVRGGIGVTALPEWMLPQQRQGLRTVRLTPRGIRRRWSAVTRASRQRSAPLARFIELLAERFSTRGQPSPRTRSRKEALSRVG